MPSRQKPQRAAFQFEHLEDRRLMAASRLADDAYENNDAMTEARSLGNLAAVTTIKNLVMADKADWYSFNVADSLTAAVNLEFSHASGDLDLKIFTASGKQVGASISRTDAESVSLKGLRAGTYYIQVFGKNGAQNPNYAMFVNPGVATPPATTIDLHGESTLATNAASWGGAFKIDAQVRNTGNTASGAFNVQWYLSKDAAGSSDDVLLSQVKSGATFMAHPSIAATSSGAVQSISLLLPKLAPTGFKGENFYVIMKMDSAAQIAESNESNNFGQLGDGVDRDRIVIGGNSASFNSFDVWDASTDDSVNTVFNGGVVRVSYSLNLQPHQVTGVTLQAIGQGGAILTLANFGAATKATQKLVNLAAGPILNAGLWQLRLKATTTSGTLYSSVDAINVLDSSYVAAGRLYADTYVYSGGIGSGQVFRGGGGTDTFELGVTQSQIASLNGVAGVSNSTANQAIYQGSAYDYLRLTDGREIYFQGFERLKFSDGSVHELAVRPFDPAFGEQWNLHVTDVPSAWRFTQGSSEVLLVSLDSGVLNSPAAPSYLGVNDLSMTRLITGPTDDEDLVLPPSYPYGHGHGHMSVSIMASMANNIGVAGINWRSSVLVTDVYSLGSGENGVTLPQAIEEGLAYARATGKKVVFQGGIQGESWLTDGGSAAYIQNLISSNSDIALFAIAAGNGGPSADGTYGAFVDANWATSVSGVAKLENYFTNVISVGALEGTNRFAVGGLSNPWSVNIASYSNRGYNLTLMAPTDSPAVDKRGNVAIFNGTSAANPNMAGIASLVWSVNTALTPEGIRQILVDTAHDLGASGDDNTYGNGLVNADAAVRRAVALARANDLANLYPNKPLQLYAAGPTLSATSNVETLRATTPSLAGVALSGDFGREKTSRVSPTSRAALATAHAAAAKVKTLDLTFDSDFDRVHSMTGLRTTKLQSVGHFDGAVAHEANLDLAFSLLSEPLAGRFDWN